jgi:hypothetical protein
VKFAQGARATGVWGLGGGRLAYSSAEARSDVWVMEVRSAGGS